MKKENTTTTATAQAQKTNTTNTTTTKGAKTMKKETTTTAQATAQTTAQEEGGVTVKTTATAPKADSKTAKKTEKKTGKKADTKKADKAQDAAALGFKPKYDPDKEKTLFSVVRVSGMKYAAPDGTIRTEYTANAAGKETSFCRNSIKSQTLADLVQKALVHAEIENLESTISDLEERADKEKDGQRKAALTEQRQSAKAALADLKKKYPGAASFLPGANPHAALVAAGIRGGALSIECETWVKSMAAASSIMTGALLDKFAGKGSASFTQEERETMSGLKDATARLFATYCAASEHNTAFNLRVKDSDIVTWYTMSASGFKGERDKFTVKVRDRWEQILTAWFLGKICREYEAK